MERRAAIVGNCCTRAGRANGLALDRDLLRPFSAQLLSQSDPKLGWNALPITMGIAGVLTEENRIHSKASQFSLGVSTASAHSNRLTVRNLRMPRNAKVPAYPKKRQQGCCVQRCYRYQIASPSNVRAAVGERS